MTYVTWGDLPYRLSEPWVRLVKSAERHGVKLTICEVEKLDLPECLTVHGVELGFFLQHPEIAAAPDDEPIMLLGGDQAFLCKPHDLPELKPNEIHMGWGRGPGMDTLRSAIVLGAHGYPDEDLLADIARLGNGHEPGSEQVMNSGSAFATKATWQALLALCLPFLERYSKQFPRAYDTTYSPGFLVMWQSLLSAIAFNLGWLKVLPQEFCAHSHWPLEWRGLKMIDGRLMAGDRPVQIIHKFYEVLPCS